MIAFRSTLAALVAAPLLASCFAGDPPPDRNPQGQALLAQRLAGKVAGNPVNCLPSYRTGDLEVIDRDTILFEAGGTTYLQNASGYCYPSGSAAGYVLVTTGIASGGRLCDGDVARTVTSSGGFTAGSCTLNPFVPYRRP